VITTSTHCGKHKPKSWSTHGAGRGRGRPWRRLRWACLTRDGFTCTWPGCRHHDPTGATLEADHIDGDIDALTNLRTLCIPHHRERTLEQARQARTMRL
jgi:hypothetical protein